MNHFDLLDPPKNGWQSPIARTLGTKMDTLGDHFRYIVDDDVESGQKIKMWTNSKNTRIFRIKGDDPIDITPPILSYTYCTG